MRNTILSIAVAFFSLTATAQVIRPMPKAGPSPEINLGNAKEFTLANGMNVIVVENHKLPQVTAYLTIDNPPFALGEKKGLDGMIGSMLGTGTANLGKDEFNGKIEQNGASVRYNATGGSMHSLTRFFPETFALFADGALNPKFSQAEFEAQKSKTLEGLKTQEKSVEAAANRVNNAIVYGMNHPFGEFITPQKVEKLSLADVQNYYNSYYKPNNAYLVIVGDITAADAKNLTEKYFGGWQKGNLNFPKMAQVNPVNKTTLSVVNMPNAIQSVVTVAYPVPLTKKDPDYYAAQVASTILGGDFGSRLNMNLREKNGFTYGARGGVRDNRYIGSFTARSTVRNEVTDKAVQETIKEIRDMGNVKVTAKELEDVKSKFLGNFILSLEDAETTANQFLTKKTNQLDANFYRDYIKNINAVTPEDVQRVSKKYFRPEQANIIVTGKAAEVGPSLEKLGYPVKYYDAYGTETAKPENKVVATNMTAQAIADKYLAAMGGRAAVQKITSQKVTATAEVQGMPIEMTMLQAQGGKQMMEMKAMGNTMQKMVFDGAKGYIMAGGQKMDLKPEQIKEMAGKSLFPELNFNAATQVLGQEKFNNEDAYAVKDGKHTYYYSVATGLKIGDVTTTERGDIPSTYSDYKAVNGVMYPYKIAQSLGGMDVTFNVQNVELNKAAAGDFQ